MCFKNLPIEFDAQGKAKLKPGAADTYSYWQGPLQIGCDFERNKERFERYHSVRRLDVDRVTHMADGVAVDVDALTELVERGCEPELAVRIVAPLAWKPPEDERRPDDALRQFPPLAPEELPNAVDAP